MLLSLMRGRVLFYNSNVINLLCYHTSVPARVPVTMHALLVLVYVEVDCVAG
jgi:hypothetical protein